MKSQQISANAPAVPRRRLYRGRDLGLALTIDDLRAMAHRRLPNFVWEYLEGGAEDEVTLRRNRESFDRYALVQHVLKGVADPNLSVRPLSGKTAALPVVIAPTGFAGLYWHGGDQALARAAAASNIPFVQSTVSNSSIEDVTAAAGVPPWFQLYVFRSRDNVLRLLDRASKLGSEVLVVTVDATTYGNREWDRRNYRGVNRLTWASKLDVLRHPAWCASILRHGIPGFANLYDFLPAKERGFARSAAWARDEVDPRFDWAGLAWLRAAWSGKLIVKGIATLDDARRVIDTGGDGLVLSNHGGRQLDGALSPMAVLPEVVACLGGQTRIMIDGGFRRGSDIVKALALGADAVLIGRSALYGLGAGGEMGVKRALGILKEEIARTMAMVGAASCRELNRDCVVDLSKGPT